MHKILLFVTVLTVCFPIAAFAQNRVRIRDICHIKGLEENSLHGVGLVVGLKGTGDEMKSSARALAQLTRMLEGAPAVPGTKNGDVDLSDVRGAKNIAVVFVTVTIPAKGARQGDALNCTITAPGAKSLAGGVLMMTPLIGPNPNVKEVFATAQGRITIEEGDQPNVGRIERGCRLERDFFNDYVKDNKITLVLNKQHAGFGAAQAVQDHINSNGEISDRGSQSRTTEIARAIDAVNIVVTIPETHLDDKVAFISQIENTPIYDLNNVGRVYINERAGVIVVGPEVTIRPSAIQHKNFAITTGDEEGATPRVLEFDPIGRGDGSQTPLQNLVTALDKLKVPPRDMIEIVKALNARGDIMGELVVE
jgi:flagellar P-ring protein precursor FlgI